MIKIKANGHKQAAKEGEEESKEVAEKKPEEAQETIDISGFDFALNPDVMSGQVPQTDEEKAQMEKDEKDVRDACAFLQEKIIPRLVYPQIHDHQNPTANLP